MSDSDASLVARVVRKDDRTAYELLVRRYQSPLRNFLRRLMRSDPDRADDLAQETFLKAYSAIGTFQGAARFSTWLYRIAYNTFLNDQRGKVEQTGFDEAYHSPTTDVMSPNDDAADIGAALGRLPIRQRAVFDLHYRKGMTHQEVASALDLPLGTIKSDLTRGRETLRQILEDFSRE